VKQKRSVVVPHVAATGSASNVPAKRRARVQGEIKGTTAMVWSLGMGVYTCTPDIFFPKTIEVNTHNIVFT
jgi:hypothetical protein